MGGGGSASTCTVVAGQPVLSLGCRILRARPSTSPACASASLVRRGGSPDITAARIAIAAYAQRPRWRLLCPPPPWVGSLVGKVEELIVNTATVEPSQPPHPPVTLRFGQLATILTFTLVLALALTPSPSPPPSPSLTTPSPHPNFNSQPPPSPHPGMDS